MHLIMTHIPYIDTLTRLSYQNFLAFGVKKTCDVELGLSDAERHLQVLFVRLLSYAPEIDQIRSATSQRVNSVYMYIYPWTEHPSLHVHNIKYMYILIFALSFCNVLTTYQSNYMYWYMHISISLIKNSSAA